MSWPRHAAPRRATLSQPPTPAREEGRRGLSAPSPVNGQLCLQLNPYSYRRVPHTHTHTHTHTQSHFPLTLYHKYTHTYHYLSLTHTHALTAFFSDVMCPLPNGFTSVVGLHIQLLLCTSICTHAHSYTHTHLCIHARFARVCKCLP